ncbi:hypothetical protein EVAR_100029_1 [Eumeta japonica]|uniref:Uncharacterized protein n=1 Tax=Eumeta variegata TaxID=151549 RepID=A0A4C1SM39_EUMVA|nr:hypothetical protein EVAR_100029_1 [Eumeta japonica]
MSQLHTATPIPAPSPLSPEHVDPQCAVQRTKLCRCESRTAANLLQQKNEPARPGKCRTLTEYGREVAASAVAIRPYSRASIIRTSLNRTSLNRTTAYPNSSSGGSTPPAPRVSRSRLPRCSFRALVATRSLVIVLRCRRRVTLLRGVRLDSFGTGSHERFRCGSVPLEDTSARSFSAVGAACAFVYFTGHAYVITGHIDAYKCLDILLLISPVNLDPPELKLQLVNGPLDARYYVSYSTTT